MQRSKWGELRYYFKYRSSGLGDMPIFTIGHSNHSIETFVSLLQQQGVTAVADVRSSPFSRRLPQFNQTLLKNSLKAEKIAYVFLGDQLGARPQDPDCYVEGKALYPRIAATDAFAMGLERLAKGARQHQIALMCAEQDPITCHRAILVSRHLKSRHLQAAGVEIQHILKTGELESQEHLEQRLVKLHRLRDRLPLLEDSAETAVGAQLELFSPVASEAGGSYGVPLTELIEQAYELQGDRIAYVEQQESDAAYEQAS